MGNTFNTVAGTSESATLVAFALGHGPMITEAFPRLRDAFIDPKKMQLVVMTRTGKGAWVDEDEKQEWHEKIEAMPGFIEAEDDDFDQTFRYWRFEIPEAWKPTVAKIIEGTKSAGIYDRYFEPPMDRFKRKVMEMKDA